MNFQESSPRVAGRGLNKPVITFTFSPYALIVRVDDQENPELWFQLELPTMFLAQALEMVEQEAQQLTDALVARLPPMPPKT